MNIDMLNTDDLIPYDNNPRNNEEAVEYVKQSIEQFGFKVPIVIDQNNVIIAGHTRLKAAQELHIEEVPVIKATDLTEEQVTAFRLADNKVAEFSQWNMKQLQKELDLINNIDMNDFGFEELEKKAKAVQEEEIEYRAEMYVLVECDDENHAEAVLMKLKEEGYECRLSEM